MPGRSAAARTPDPPAAPHGDDPWRVVETACDPERLATFASLFTIGNGWFGTRGTFEETPTDAGYDRGLPATYLAGFFDARPGESPEIANGPHWLPLRFEVDGHLLSPLDSDVEILAYERVLDLRVAILRRTLRLAILGGRVAHLIFERFASLAQPWLSAIRATLRIDGGDAGVDWSAALDGDTENDGYPHYIPVHVEAGERAPLFLRLETRQSKRTVSAASVVDARVGTRRLRAAESGVRGARAEVRGRVRLTAGRTLEVVKWVAWATSAEGIEDFDGEAVRRLAEARKTGWAKALRAHTRAWERFWDEADVVVEGDPFLQKAVRFSLYHLRIAVPENDCRVSIAAKTLSGPGYSGRVFWDTELFILPFFDWVMPDLARQLLMYRYVGLAGARRKAASLNCEGAAYPWEAADTGDEACPVWLGSRDPAHRGACRNGVQQVHVTGDVVYAWHRHARITGDRALLHGPGAEILYETARFWASRATDVPARGRYEIRDVVGPDEFHEGVANNFYTNALARWNIARALVLTEELRATDPRRFFALFGQAGGDAKDLWMLRHVRDRIWIPPADRTGLIEQFDGYFGLEHAPSLRAWERRHSGESFWGRHQATQFLKQPDVVMYQWLFPEQFSSESIARNFDYYLKRTLHGSSLSLCIHAIQGAQLGRPIEGLELLRRAAGIDLCDRMGNAGAGIHAAAAGGVWMGLVLGLAGVRESEEALCLRPALPPSVRRLSFRVRWRGTPLAVEVGDGRWRVEPLRTRHAPLRLSVAGRVHRIEGEKPAWGRLGT